MSIEIGDVLLYKGGDDTRKYTVVDYHYGLLWLQDSHTDGENGYTDSQLSRYFVTEDGGEL